MKRVATIILNRNLPDVTNKLYETIQQHNGDETDIFVVESGSEEKNLSKYCTWWANWEESLEHGLRFPRGFNFAFSKLLEEKKYHQYEFFLLLLNDTEIESKTFVKDLLQVMDEHQRVGVLSPCSKDWGESDLLKENETRYFWYVNHIAWLMRRTYIDSIREVEKPSYMNFIYDGENFRGYESEIELIIKGYANDWATAITKKVMVRENKSLLINRADLIKTEPYEESLVRCLVEGQKWMRRKYGFNSRWSMQLYAKFFYEQFFEYYPQLKKCKI